MRTARRACSARLPSPALARAQTLPLADARGGRLFERVAALAVAPGGIAEMCVTAKVMHLGVPVVTAFQVARVVVLVLSSGVVYRVILRRQSVGA